MSDAWFQYQIAPDGVAADGCHPDEAKALQLYINGKANLHDTARAITRPLLSDENPDGTDQPLWGLIQNALLELSPTHISDLISLLQAINGQLERELGPKLPKSTNKDSKSTWIGLRNFAHLWADVYTHDNWRDNIAAELSAIPNVDDRLQKRAELRAAHIRQANVAARLTAPSIGLFPLDWAYEAITDALETDGAIIDFEIPALVEWIEIVGKELYQGAKEGEQSWALGRERLNGTHEKKMSLARWKSWKEKIREYEEQNKDITKVGKKLREEMRKLET